MPPTKKVFSFKILFAVFFLNSVDSNAEPIPIAIGKLKQLVILANFPETSTTFTTEIFQDLFSQPGYSSNGARGSVHDWFTEVSGGMFDPEFHVTSWISLPRGSSYYKDPENWDDMGTDTIVALDASGFDFSSFDQNKDGFIDLPPVIVHQGAGAEDEGNNFIVSHEASFPQLAVDEVRISSYCTVPELFGSQITRIGVVIHEMGHNFGLPEMYDAMPLMSGTSVAELSYGIGLWTSMGWWARDELSLYPGHYGAWERIQLGWTQPVILTASATEIEVNEESVYKILVNGSQTEYYLIENRQKVGFDRELPGSGLVIYHVDETKWDDIASSSSQNNIDENHRHVDVVQADGLANLNQPRYRLSPFGLNPNANRGDAGDPFPGSTNRTELRSDTIPALTSYSADDPNFSLNNIRMVGAIGFFDINIVDNYKSFSAAFDWGGTPIADRDADDDANKNGVNNLMEFAFNMSPTAPGSPITLTPGTGTSGMPAVSVITPETPTLRIEYLRRKNSGLSYKVKFSDNLVTWEDAVATPTPISINSDWERMVMPDTAGSGRPKRFARVVVSEGN